MDVIDRKLSQILFSSGRLNISPLDKHFQSPNQCVKKLNGATYREIKEGRGMTPEQIQNSDRETDDLKGTGIKLRSIPEIKVSIMVLKSTFH